MSGVSFVPELSHPTATLFSGLEEPRTFSCCRHINQAASISSAELLLPHGEAFPPAPAGTKPEG